MTRLLAFLIAFGALCMVASYLSGCAAIDPIASCLTHPRNCN